MKLSEFRVAIVYVNLDHREDRRLEIERQLASHGLTADRQPGVNSKQVRDPWGFQNERRYACSLAKRLAIRRGMRTGADAVLLLEDDVVFHPEFHQRVLDIQLPVQWGLFYLGCRHIWTPETVARGMVRCKRAVDNHAVIIHRSFYHQVLRGLAGTRRGGERTIPFSDEKLASLHSQIPSYAAYPNLAWQGFSYSDTGNRHLMHYRADGSQDTHREAIEGLDCGTPPSQGAAVIHRIHPPRVTNFNEIPAVIGRGDCPLVECVVVIWGSRNLEQLITAFRSQTVACQITLGTSGRLAGGDPVPEHLLSLVDRVYRTSLEVGPANWFFPASMYECEFIYFHDDEMIPGKELISHFLEHARRIRHFGALGQQGRRLVNGGYSAADVPRSDQPEQVDVLVRGVFLPAGHLPLILESLHLIGREHRREDLEPHLVLAWTMARLGLKCWLTPWDADPETCMALWEPGAPPARSGRTDHYQTPDRFIPRFREQGSK